MGLRIVCLISAKNWISIEPSRHIYTARATAVCNSGIQPNKAPPTAMTTSAIYCLGLLASVSCHIHHRTVKVFYKHNFEKRNQEQVRSQRMTDSECCPSEVFSMEDYGFFSDAASCCTDSTLEETITESPSPSPPPYARCERSVSLSSALKKPNSHSDKKAVHFADSLGLDLVHIRPFVSFGDPDDEIFGTTPPLYFKGFHQASYVTTLPAPPPRKISTVTPPTFAVPTYLHTHFTPVGGHAWQNTGNPNERLIAKTFKQGVCLKSVNSIGTNLTGTVAVVNYAYQKEVL
uniref:Uncharacterized protein n=1 Tax=Ascaris lumbricoides TaxID=6252 RepID=A0A9J2Q2L8_ASCLU